MSRYSTYAATVIASLVFLGLGAWKPPLLWPLAVTLPLAALGTWDLVQRKHSLLRNYPILAHLRWLFEGIRPEIRQYLFESEISGTPFTREQRSLVYQRAKSAVDQMPFGTELDVYEENYAWLNHSTVPREPAAEPYRITVGDAQCTRPYSASVYNISAMSFGSIGANAILALNLGAKLGNFAHDTGEGGISPYHRRHGGDLVWEIGSGYFGCRDERGRLDAVLFAERASDDQIKMIELKLSQGAKPGHGGVLPSPKVTPEIAATRGVPLGVDCISPSAHPEFSTPIELMELIGKLRELAGGKPAGFKLCIGHHWEFLAICKAMMATEILPDFIVVDGAEGGTGAAPVEFSNHVGMPLREGLNFAQNALVGSGLRRHIKLGASGKIVSAFDMVAAMALGADWCNSARGFMFAVGCVQAQACHTNRCPSGVATQDPLRQRALVVSDKAERVFRFHRNTVRALAEVVAAAGLEHPSDLRPEHFYARLDTDNLLPADKAFTWLAPNELLEGTASPEYAQAWARADAESFTPRSADA